MQVICFIKPKIKNDICLTHLCISTDLNYIYTFDEFNNNIYIIHQNSLKSGH